MLTHLASQLDLLVRERQDPLQCVEVRRVRFEHAESGGPVQNVFVSAQVKERARRTHLDTVSSQSSRTAQLLTSAVKHAKKSATHAPSTESALANVSSGRR